MTPGTPEDFAECIKKACSEDSPERIKKRRARVARSSWDSKADLVLGECCSKRNRKVKS